MWPQTGQCGVGIIMIAIGAIMAAVLHRTALCCTAPASAVLHRPALCETAQHTVAAVGVIVAAAGTIMAAVGCQCTGNRGHYGSWGQYGLNGCHSGRGGGHCGRSGGSSSLQWMLLLPQR